METMKIVTPEVQGETSPLLGAVAGRTFSLEVCSPLLEAQAQALGHLINGYLFELLFNVH
jgi:hypothetical protein